MDHVTTHHFVDVTVIPLFDLGGGPLVVKFIFADVTRNRKLQEELKESQVQLKTASEALPSPNEELETTNEEFQSANEELETTEEELQSTNEELETTNEQLRERSEELDRASTFSEVILASLFDAVVVVDRDLRVSGWYRRAEDLWGLRADEVKDKHLLNLDIGLPVDELRAILNGEAEVQEVTLHATNRRGKAIRA
jgi:two-component system, chemotaxis family, CheB/CheR fusion protein